MRCTLFGNSVGIAVAALLVAPRRRFQSRNATRDNKKTLVVPRHIQLAVRNDEELKEVALSKLTIASGGVMPNIHNLCRLRKPVVVLPIDIHVSQWHKQTLL
ncbi:hypothetical protein Syun_003448 [Stephania yunnanensis]|uniref:Histone H2A C-terminal domain-containing protein n=1 Tax=Stephania yunnanensis TaxID=152371 RepID=A0AAP0L1B8_9MAGN